MCIVENDLQCSSARDLFDELCREEKDLLKKHKDQFKSVVKQKQVRFPVTITFEDFQTEISIFYQETSPTQLTTHVQHLLHEYYIYKVN